MVRCSGPAYFYFNPRSPHGERRRRSLLRRTNQYFNPRSPHGERRIDASHSSMRRFRFQSTLPARGATASTPSRTPTASFQSTLPARGATGPPGRTTALRSDFNPRSPHGERRFAARCCRSVRRNFNPRSPHGERPDVTACVLDTVRNFNPRSPHGERHVHGFLFCPFLNNFNPRSPHGERLADKGEAEQGDQFQSTLPARGATGCQGVVRAAQQAHFNPRSPHGERRSETRRNVTDISISIHAPRTGSDLLYLLLA